MILDRKTPPAKKRPTNVPALNVNPQPMPHGLTGYTVEGGDQDLVKIDVVFKAGTRYEKKSLVAATCLNMLKEGSQNYSGGQIAETFDFYGAQFGFDISKDRAEVSFLCLNKHLEKTMDILADLLTRPTFGKDELELIKTRSASALSVNLQKVKFQCRLMFSELFWGDTAYRDNFDPADYKRFDRNDLQTFFTENYALENAFCVISGKNTDRAARFFAERLDRKEPLAKAGQGSSIVLGWNYGTREKYTPKDNAVQSAIRLGVPVPGRESEGYPALFIANTALGGYFGSRLMQNIREEKGYTYGIGSKLNMLESAASLIIVTECGADYTGDVLLELRKELERLINEPIPADEFELLQFYISGNLLKSFDGPFSRAQKLKNVLKFGLGKDFYSNLTKRIFSIKAEDVQAVCAKHLQPGGFCQAVVGKM